MLTLAVDTTAESGSIALADENGVREEVLIHAPQGFSQVLFGEIEALLERQGVSLAKSSFLPEHPAPVRLREFAWGSPRSKASPKFSGNGW